MSRSTAGRASPARCARRPDGQVTARVFPYDVWDQVFYTGVTADVWMEPGVTAESLPETMAVAYHAPRAQGGVALVLGGGNVSSIGPMDALYKLFVEDQVVLFKTHPVNVYLGPLLEEGFKPADRPRLPARGLWRRRGGGLPLPRTRAWTTSTSPARTAPTTRSCSARRGGTAAQGAGRAAWWTSASRPSSATSAR